MSDPMKVIEVTWTDSCTMYTSWTREADVDIDCEEMLIISVGYLFRETEKSILVLQSLDQQNPPYVKCITMIPKVAIVKMEVIRDA